MTNAAWPLGGGGHNFDQGANLMAVVAAVAHHEVVRSTARTLHNKALSSMRTAMTSFNSPYDDGRATCVLLHLQHSFEMLLKAALSQTEIPR